MQKKGEYMRRIAGSQFLDSASRTKKRVDQLMFTNDLHRALRMTVGCSNICSEL